MALLLSQTTGHAQQFINLDFEMATVPAGATTLSWDQAAPGWQHSSGADTATVDSWHNPFPPLPASTQQFLLREATPGPRPHPFPIQGSYAMDFQSGEESPFGPSPWVQAFLAQTGEVPTDAKAIRMLAFGEFKVMLDGQTIPMQLIGPSAYLGDVSAFSGRVATLKIINLTDSYNTSVVLDDIRFSASAVPEPGTWALMGLGLVGIAVASSQRRPR